MTRVPITEADWRALGAADPTLQAAARRPTAFPYPVGVLRGRDYLLLAGGWVAFFLATQPDPTGGPPEPAALGVMVGLLALGFLAMGGVVLAGRATVAAAMTAWQADGGYFPPRPADAPVASGVVGR